MTVEFNDNTVVWGEYTSDLFTCVLVSDKSQLLSAKTTTTKKKPTNNSIWRFSFYKEVNQGSERVRNFKFTIKTQTRTDSPPPPSCCRLACAIICRYC